jgi:glutathionylspermidine synthase
VSSSMTASVPAPRFAPTTAKPASQLRAEIPIDVASFSFLRRRALLEGCKWDPQVGDVATLANFPLVMKSSVWGDLAAHAEKLAAESATAEIEILQRPELLKVLGLPRALRRVLAESTPLSPAAGRVMRFDFHNTTEGWRISEANSDVPGGFTEASFFTSLMAEHFPDLRSAGCPGERWARALSAAAGTAGFVALLSAPGYMEDHQVIAFLAALLRENGCPAFLGKPEQITWRDGVAHLDTRFYRGPLNVVVRFYQSEWLSSLPERCGWKNLYRGGKTRVANPGSGVISESKRFPLVWEELSTPLPTWRALLPETRDPRTVRWASDESWLVKTALCKTGDTVCIRELMPAGEWLRTRLAVQLRPENWVAQKRFESVPVETPVGPRHVCVGVYTVNGQAGGAYARLSAKPIIDFAAVDVALLLEDDD